ncbi:HGxxPAAW family protein [Streptomyces sp.]|uniref:HGxxPAAW family protein n=1 Tax=Streptomyces sp. TaxID=1931 RepID=UPI002F3F6D62
MAGHDHGHTLAAWTGVTISFIGFCVSGAFIIAAQPVGFWAGIALTLLGAVVGGGMKMMGLGRKEEPPVLEAAERAELEQSPVRVNA